MPNARSHWHPAHAVTVRNPIGAGDALVGGLAAALERGETLEAAVRAGVATAAASVETATAGEIDPLRAAELQAAGAPPEQVAGERPRPRRAVAADGCRGH